MFGIDRSAKSRLGLDDEISNSVDGDGRHEEYDVSLKLVLNSNNPSVRDGD